MNDSLEPLTEKRKRWVEINRENGFEDGIKRLLTDLYPDNAHFIYELLQNAEDARDKARPNSSGASVVRFTLSSDSLEVEHDGEGLFTLADVESITSIGVSSKRDDPTSIGKFGVGFKAVFAYTNTPEIHSGGYNFRIRDLVVPEAVGAQTKTRVTRFIFPFNHPKKSATQAEMEITKGLRELGDNTLLFLKHIRKIEFLLADGSIGSQERIEHGNERIEIHTLRPNGKKLVSHWLRFEKTVCVADEEGKEKDCRVAIAYSLTNSAKEGEQSAWKVTPLEHGQVSIFFPAEKEVSNLRFHVHAPFASTVARDSVRDCDANKVLLRAIADLTANTLETLRDLGLLNVASYAALPIRAQDFPESHLFHPIYEKVREALKTQPLLPAHGGNFIKAEEAKLARGKKLVELFSAEQLGSLFGKEKLAWLDASITADGATTDLHTYLVGRKKPYSQVWEVAPLVEGIQVDSDTPLARKLTADFLIKQSMDWLIRFIQYTEGREPLKKVPLVRLASGRHVPLPSDKDTEPSAWFVPKDAAGLDLSEFQLVHAELTTNEPIRKFLEKEGIREIDAAGIVGRCILPLYKGADTLFDESSYRDHLHQIRKAYTEANDIAKTQLTTSLSGVAWLACVHASGNALGKIFWKKPGASDVFAKTAEHENWFCALNNVEAYFLHPATNEELRDVIASLVKQATALTQNLHTSETTTVSLYNESYGYHKQGLSGFKPDATVIGVQAALDSWNTERARILWKVMLSAPRIIRGETQGSTNRQKLDAANKELEYTDVGKLCREHVWLPDRAGNWQKPSALFLTDLPEEFDTSSFRAKDVAKKLGMKNPVDMSSIASAFGITTEEAERRMNVTPEELAEIELRRQDKLHRPTMPDKVSPDPERRAVKTVEGARNTPERTQETRARTVDPDYGDAQGEARTYLKHQYTNDDGVMFCQLCQHPQPVLLDGVPHFEAVDCVDGINAHYEQNNLALCPNHAAMYKNSGLTPDAIQHAILECDGQKIPLNLAGNEKELYFTQQHLGDLRAVLQGLPSTSKV